METHGKPILTASRFTISKLALRFCSSSGHATSRFEVNEVKIWQFPKMILPMPKICPVTLSRIKLGLGLGLDLPHYLIQDSLLRFLPGKVSHLGSRGKRGHSRSLGLAV